MSHHSPIARRAFLRRAAHLGIAGTAAPWALNLAAISDAAAFSSDDNYKALVCIFLYGGNDNGNTVIPYDSTGHAEYLTARGGRTVADQGIALARADLAATAVSTAGLPAGRQYALAPSLAALKPLFEKDMAQPGGKLAVQMNVGPLRAVTTLQDFRNRVSWLPPKLFSHNDQQSVWQSSQAEGSVRGWGGNLGDLALSRNGGNSLFTCMSVTGNAVFLAGDDALAYQIGSSGAVAIDGITNAGGLYSSAACQAALRTLVTQNRAHALENELNAITRRSVDSQAALSSALASSAGLFDAVLPSDDAARRALSLNRQLKMVARLIQARASLGLKRQVFLVSLGGFDTHDNLNLNHPRLLKLLADAMAGFQTAVDAMEQSDPKLQVTTFTASDFGRTMTSNGNGSDHGWGSHHFVMGSGVVGKRFYGEAPGVAAGHANDVGQGRLLPSTSVDQYAATLARWFGVSDGELAQVAPNIGNFSLKNLGFLG